MKTAQLLFVASISLAGVVGFAPSAISGYECTEFFGETKCSGTINGQSVNTTTRTNILGQQETKGTIGGRSYSETCYEFLGRWKCD